MTDGDDGGPPLRWKPLEPDQNSDDALARGDLDNVRPGEPGVFGCQTYPDDNGPLVRIDDEFWLPGSISVLGKVRLQGLSFRRDETGMLIVSPAAPPTTDFYEEDEPLEDVLRAWNAPGEKGRTAPPTAGTAE